MHDHTMGLAKEDFDERVHRLAGFPLRTPGWQLLQDALKSVGTSAMDVSSDTDIRGMVFAAVLLDSPAMMRGPLARLDDLQRFLLELEGRNPMTFVRVLGVAPLLEPCKAGHFSAELAPHCVAFRLNAASVQSPLARLHACRPEPVGTTIQNWQREHHLHHVVLGTCLQAWAPLAVAIAKQSWCWIPFRLGARVDRGCSGKHFFDIRNNDHQPMLPSHDDNVDGSQSRMCPQAFRELAEHFRSCAACIVHGEISEDMEALQTSLEMDVIWLGRTADAMESIKE